jgi:translation initiation factor IF-2
MKMLENQSPFTGKIIPIIIKTEVSGSIEAIEKEMMKLNTSEISFKIIGKGVGAINESDLKMGNVNRESIIVGFNTKMDSGATDLNETLKVRVEIFDIIYKLIDWLKILVEERRPRMETIEVIGAMKVLKTFGSTKGKHVVGGKVTTGRIAQGSIIRIVRRDFEIGNGKITELQINKLKMKEAFEGSDCGIQVETKIDVAPGDVLEAFQVTVK